MWTHVYDRTTGDFFDLQDELARTILNHLHESKLIRTEETAKETKSEINPKAYKLYQEGQYYYNKWTPQYAEMAVEKFNEALKIEPEFSDAYGGLALAYTLLASTGWMDPMEGSKLATEKANKALSSDPENEDALSALSVSDYFFLWDFKAGDERTKQALEHNPRSVQANLARSLHFMIRSDIPSALACLNVAREIDPLSIIVNRTLADAHYFAGNYQISVEVYDWLLEKDPEFLTAKEFKAWSLMMMGRIDEAIELFESIKDTVYTIKPYVQLGYAYALKGKTELALENLEKLKKEAREKTYPLHDFNLATLYSALRMYDEAFEAIESCIQAKLGPMVFFHISPIWKPLRDDPRFEEVVKRIGLGPVKD